MAAWNAADRDATLPAVLPAGVEIHDLMGNAMLQMKQSIGAMAESVNGLIEAAVEGQLDARADAGKFSGEYYNIVQGVNDTLDAVVGPLNVAAEYVGHYRQI